MPCPFSSGSLDLGSFYRRDVLRGALALGGASALSACVDSRGTPDVPRGSDDPESLPDRQYAWNDYLPRDSHGNLIFPYHQLLLFFEYAGDDIPDDAERERVDAALRSIERAYQRGNGGTSPYRPGGSSVPGVLYTLGYSRSYFERFDEDLPAGIDLPSHAAVLTELGEPDERADGHDAAMLLTSDHPQLLLAIELALFGDLDELNGVPMEGTFAGVFEKRERRTGFIGPGVPRRELDMDEIPKRAPLGMGFVSGFSDNQAAESKVAIGDGPFADGTIQHVSRLTLDLDRWYDRDRERRTAQMFSPHHTAEEVGEVGEFLAADSGLTPEIGRRVEEDAAECGVVGHTQKLAAARDENFEPLLLRRSEALSIDGERPGFNFTSLQRSMEHFVRARRAMNEAPDGVEADRNGILDYISVRSRGNYLIPPRRLAALPPAAPE